MDAIHQLKFMEVDQQANGDVEQFHVAEQLGLVDRQYLLDRFEFEQQAAFDQNVETNRSGSSKTKPLYSTLTMRWLTAVNSRRLNSRRRHFS